MATITPDDRKAFTLRMFLNDIPHVPIFDPRFDLLNGLFQTLPRVFDQFPSLFTGSPNEDSLIEITVVFPVVDCDVDVDDVSVLQGSHVGDAVTNHFVDGGATAFGELENVKWGVQFE